MPREAGQDEPELAGAGLADERDPATAVGHCHGRGLVAEGSAGRRAHLDGPAAAGTAAAARGATARVLLVADDERAVTTDREPLEDVAARPAGCRAYRPHDTARPQVEDPRVAERQRVPVLLPRHVAAGDPGRC